MMLSFFLFKQKTAYEMRISDWSSDVCSSDLRNEGGEGTDVADAIDDRRHAQRSDGQPGEIGSGDYTDAQGAAYARFPPAARKGRTTATARHQNDTSEPQADHGPERFQNSVSQAGVPDCCVSASKRPLQPNGGAAG